MEEKEKSKKEGQKEKAGEALLEAVKCEFLNALEDIDKYKECKDAKAYVRLGLSMKSMEELKSIVEGHEEELKSFAVEKYGEDGFEDMMKIMIKGMMNYAIENIM